jgi:hypothetical protein
MVVDDWPVGQPVGTSEADARAKLIDPATQARGWLEDLIRREETAGAIGIKATLQTRHDLSVSDKSRLV